MIVVFDSNVWLSELGMRSGAAAAVRFFVKQSGARVGIPEVVRLEVSINLRARLIEHIEDIRSNYGQLLVAFGSLREIVLPDDAQVGERVDSLFTSLGVEQFDIPFSLESAKSSFLKTVRKEPPSKQSQQFKDGVIWADCLKLLDGDTVTLVTSDKAFYEDREYKNGLAKSLLDEAAVRSHAITVLPDLSDLLEAMQETIPVDAHALQATFLSTYRDSVEGILQRTGFALRSRVGGSTKLFATDDPSVLFLEFSLQIGCDDVTEQGRTDAILTLGGFGSYIPQTREFRDLRGRGEQLKFRLADGTESEVRNVVMFADGITLGHREITNVTRHLLP